MKKNELKVYIIELLLIIILFFTVFAPNIITRYIFSVIMFVFALLTCVILKRRKTNSIYKKQTTILMIIFALMYIGIFYLMGLYFGFNRAKILLSTQTIVKFIFPIIIIIISAEIIRNILLQQDAKIHIRKKELNISLMLTYIAMVLVDLIIYTDIYNLANLDDFLEVLGFILFASFSCNLLYNYISIRYNIKGIILYRLITVLYIYIIPIIPDVYIFFRSFLRMICPYIIYVIFEKMYSQNTFTVSYNEKRKNLFGNSILFVIMILLVMLISCQFHFGILVIGSKSMTGTINKGDAVIFEKYNGQNISKGQVIIFDYNGIQTVHRVDDIQIVNDEYRYYTKGDANLKRDAGYITENKVYGLVKLKVKYIGYPTIWIRELFS